MPDWRQELRDLTRELGGHARRVARAIDRTVDRDPYHVAGYRGYASRWRALVVGRVLQDEGIQKADPEHRGWQNLLNTLRRLESDPMAFANVSAKIGDSTHELIADDEGFLHEWVKLPTPLEENVWHPVDTTTQSSPDSQARFAGLSRKTRAASISSVQSPQATSEAGAPSNAASSRSLPGPC